MLSRRGALIGISIWLAIYVFCWLASTIRLVNQAGGVLGVIINTLWWTPILFISIGMLVVGMREKEKAIGEE